MKISDKVLRKRGILLDLGNRFPKEKNWLRIAGARGEDVDVIHDLEAFPYPLPDGACLTIKAAHVAEHIPPKLFFKWMDEMWRMLKIEGQLVMSCPYAGSIGHYSDPTHVTAINEVTFQFLDPSFPAYTLYRPKPWDIQHASWAINKDLEAVLRKRKQ